MERTLATTPAVAITYPVRRLLHGAAQLAVISEVLPAVT
jgi:hypothetical protein